MLFDSHTHLSHPSFDGDREEVIKKLRDFDIKTITVGADMEESEKAVDLAEKYPNQIWATVGLHPYEAAKSIDWIKLKKLAANQNAVAIGECGLDYFKVKNCELGIKEKQKELFLKQIELAKELGKPLIIHCRSIAGTMDAHEDAIEILKYKNLNISNNNGVVHFFSGSKEIAKKFLDLGFYISFAGPITFGEEYKEAIQCVPLDRILAETDSPFAAPIPHRGQRNEPAFVEFVVRQIARWKEMSFEEAARQTADNSKALFNID
ncbi:MAG: Mg-dependent DNase [Candidatus Azambacteria bacterium GW2011_GWB1_42_72]|nr:MAG: Mg-dependent DNase [Candidatus Azambacteria bacterium GW2011_GWB1_42_72]